MDSSEVALSRSLLQTPDSLYGLSLRYGCMEVEEDDGGVVYGESGVG